VCRVVPRRHSRIPGRPGFRKKKASGGWSRSASRWSSLHLEVTCVFHYAESGVMKFTAGACSDGIHSSTAPRPARHGQAHVNQSRCRLLVDDNTECLRLLSVCERVQGVWPRDMAMDMDMDVCSESASSPGGSGRRCTVGPGSGHHVLRQLPSPRTPSRTAAIVSERARRHARRPAHGGEAAR
jgi:hypothetical protein